MPYQYSTSPAAGVYSLTGAVRERTWYRTANYFGTKRSDLPINEYNDYRVLASQPYYDGNWQIDLTTGAVTVVTPPGIRLPWDVVASAISSICSGELSLQIPDAAAIFNRVLVKALVKVADQKTNLAVSLKEASKTSDLILDTAKRLDKAYRAFRRGDFRSITKHLDITPGRVHKTWLGYKYGWMPLLMDVKNSAEFFAQSTLGGRPIRFVVSASEKFSSSRVDPNVGMHNPLGNIFVPVSRSYTVDNVVKVKLWLEITNPRLAELQQLGVTNPALYVWEVIPYSFVFDWFISVGDYLTGLSALHGVTLRKAMRSSQTVATSISSWPASTASQGNTGYVETGSSYGGSVRAYWRTIPSVNPLDLWPPRNSDAFGFQKLVTSLALIRANHRGSPSGVRV